MDGVLAKLDSSSPACTQVRCGEGAVCGSVSSSHHFVGLSCWGCLASGKGTKRQGGVAQEEPRPASIAPEE